MAIAMPHIKAILSLYMKKNVYKDMIKFIAKNGPKLFSIGTISSFQSFFTNENHDAKRPCIRDDRLTKSAYFSLILGIFKKAMVWYGSKDPRV